MPEKTNEPQHFTVPQSKNFNTISQDRTLADPGGDESFMEHFGINNNFDSNRGLSINHLN